MAVAEIVETRTCRRCSKELPLTLEHFAGRGTDSDGQALYRYVCRTCRRTSARPAPKPPEEHCPGRLLPRVPAPPLGAKLVEVVAGYTARDGFTPAGDEVGWGGIGALCRKVGIAERTFHRWREEKQETTAFDVADRVLTRLGWLWFDVWNERTVLLPDGSTDWETLAKVEHDFTCAGCAACALAAHKAELAEQRAAAA